jgi:hypothetical protein
MAAVVVGGVQVVGVGVQRKKCGRAGMATKGEAAQARCTLLRVQWLGRVVSKGQSGTRRAGRQYG